MSLTAPFGYLLGRLYLSGVTDFSNDIERCLKVLHEGGIILYPTDTIWGIGCDAADPLAAEKIISLKRRPADKSFVVLVASERDVLQHVAAPDLAVFDYIAQQKKPTTVIYQHPIGIADNVLAADGTVAIRICHDEFCRHLVRRFRKPIVSTSANISGQPFPAHFNEIDPAIINGVDYTVQYRQDDNSPASPSAVIRWENGKLVIIRA